VSQPIFITGTGTGVGKTLVAAILTEALEADYWKPVQAGYEEGTDAEFVASMLSNPHSKIFPETYKLKLAASPHIAAAEEGVKISLDIIAEGYTGIQTTNKPLIIEGAGGLLVPLNENEFVADLIKKLDARVVLVSRNYLGSINHSLLTAEVCRQRKINVSGWIFTDQYLSYEEEIVNWSGYPKLASIAKLGLISKEVIAGEAIKLLQQIKDIL
jgi:dethiobiotin synthetase